MFLQPILVAVRRISETLPGWLRLQLWLQRGILAIFPRILFGSRVVRFRVDAAPKSPLFSETETPRWTQPSNDELV